MSTVAWTVGRPESYEANIRIPGNAKAPGGVVFPTRWDAEIAIATFPAFYGMLPYEVRLPGTWDEGTTHSRGEALTAYHLWHTSGSDAVPRDARCSVCRGDVHEKSLDYACLLVEAPFVMPGEAT